MRALCGRLRWTATQQLSHQRTGGWKYSTKSLSEAEGLCSLADSEPTSSSPSKTPVASTHLHSVLRVHRGSNTFAVATVAFGALPAEAPGGASACTADAASIAPAAQRAAQVALLAIRGALGSRRLPSALVALPSLDLPRPAVAALAEALAGQLGPDTPLMGCSSRLRLPDERRSVLHPHHRYHVTLAAMYLPHHEVLAVRCETSSLPRLPYLAEALKGRWPPAFLLMAGSDSLAAELLTRLENLFPGSTMGAGVAAQQLGRDRRLMLVGPGSSSGGGGGRTSDRQVQRPAGRGQSGPASGPEGTGLGGTRSAPAAGTAATAEATSTSDGTGDVGGSAASSEFEGHFQRMLLDRDGSSAAGSSSGGSGDGDSSGNSGDSSTGNSAGGSRRRRPAPGAAGSRRAGDTGDAAAAAAALAEEQAVAADVDQLQPPFVLLGDQIHVDGGVLLAVYPRLVASPAAPEAAQPLTSAATAAGTAATATATVAAELRLDAASCDSLTRLALGTDHLHHVVLRGASLAAISPQPTGPEPAVPYPAAPDNPFYWTPAHVALPGLRQLADPGSNPGEDALGAELEFVGSGLASSAAEGGGDELRAGSQAHDVDPDGHGDGGEDEDMDAMEHLGAGFANVELSNLPLFPLEGVILFPGQTIQLRIFEKRYRLLVRSCLRSGGAIGLCWRGMGTTAVVRSYQAAEGGSGDVMVLLEGGMRFAYDGDHLNVLPASYGINITSRAEYVIDDPAVSDDDAAALLAAAHSVLDCIAGALEEATAPSVQQTARTFANALHFAGSSTPTAPGSSPSSNQQPSSVSAASVPEPSDAALLAEDLSEAKRALDSESASLLSLYLAPHIPVHLESLRREWYTSRSTLWRLQQEAAWLKSSPRVAMAAAASVLRLPRDHPLRIMLGLSRVAAVQG